MRGCKLKLYLVILLILSFSCLAFKVDLKPESRRILLNETAVFDITIKHSSLETEIFELYSPDIFWNIRPENVLRVPSHEIFKTKLFVRPLNLNPGSYGIPVIFRQVSTNEKIDERIVVEIGSPFPVGQYLPAVKGTPEIKREIDPRESLQIAINLENKNKRDLPVVEVKVRSNLINQDYVTSLGPLKQKKVKFTVKLDNLTKPQDDILYITVLVPEEDRVYQFDLFPTPIKIISYGGIKKEISIEESFLKTTTAIKIFNDGNGDHYFNYIIKAGLFKRLFSKSSPEMIIKDGVFEWSVLVEPQKEKILTFEVNYRPLFWIVIVLFALMFCYYVFRSPVVIKKSARVIKTREGGISDIKVILEVVHRGYRKIKNFEMIDLIPQIAELINEKSATIEPFSITKSEHKGTLIKWKIGDLDPKDHRIITYSIRSKLSILGGLKLPVCVAKFRTDYREREITSNFVNLKFTSE